MADELKPKFDAFKINPLLRGLSFGFNMEMQIDLLYNYVNLIPNKALLVTNIFKKVINAEFIKACVIYWMIISKHLKNESDLSKDERLLSMAFENAIDFYLVNFKEIMGKYVNFDRVEFEKIK